MFYEQFVIDFGSRFYRLNLKNNFTDIIFICVGSNKITGDSLGPIVGAKLKQKLGTNIAIIGTTETPVNYENIKRSEEHTSELQSRGHLVCRLLLEKKKK